MDLFLVFLYRVVGWAFCDGGDLRTWCVVGRKGLVGMERGGEGKEKGRCND